LERTLLRQFEWVATADGVVGTGNGVGELRKVAEEVATTFERSLA
jgi:hypothetical protein